MHYHLCFHHQIQQKPVIILGQNKKGKREWVIQKAINKKRKKREKDWHDFPKRLLAKVVSPCFKTTGRALRLWPNVACGPQGSLNSPWIKWDREIVVHSVVGLPRRPVKWGPVSADQRIQTSFSKKWMKFNLYVLTPKRIIWKRSMISNIDISYIRRTLVPVFRENDNMNFQSS